MPIKLHGSHSDTPLHTIEQAPTDLSSELELFVHCSPQLTESIKSFANTIIRHLDNAMEVVNLMKWDELCLSGEAKFAIDKLKEVFKYALLYVEEVEDLFHLWQR